MNLSIVKAGGKQIGRILYRNSPTILTWLGVSGFVGTIFMAVKATPKAESLIEEAKLEKEKEFLVDHAGILNFDEKDAVRRLSKIEVIKAAWKIYLPTAAVGTVSILCFVGANSINLRRNAAIASLYSVTRKAFDEYQNKVIEEIGKSKEEKIHEKIMQDKLNEHPVDERTILKTGRGQTLFFDPWSSRYFYSEPEFVRKVINDFNQRVLTDSYRDINALYFELGLEGIRDGDNIGWVVDKTGIMDMVFTTKLTPDERPCIVIDYRNGPRELKWP